MHVSQKKQFIYIYIYIFIMYGHMPVLYTYINISIYLPWVSIYTYIAKRYLWLLPGFEGGKSTCDGWHRCCVGIHGRCQEEWGGQGMRSCSEREFCPKIFGVGGRTESLRDQVQTNQIFERRGQDSVGQFPQWIGRKASGDCHAAIRGQHQNQM